MLCERQRIGNGMLLPYHARAAVHLRRAGGGGGRFGRGAGAAAWFGRFSAALLVLAAALFLALALRRMLPGLTSFERAPRFWGRLLGRWTRAIPRGSAAGEFLLGVALGFLPCGFLYAALAAAAASGRPALGAAGMVAFGLGTVPG